MPALNRSRQPHLPERPGKIDSERNRVATVGLNLSPEERAMLKDPEWMDEDEADGIMSMRNEKHSAGETISLRKYLSKRRRHLSGQE